MAWFLCPYKRMNPLAAKAARYCAMQDFNAQIKADGGTWAEVEVLGDKAVVKVVASAATLTAINAATGFTRFPKDILSAPLSDLTVNQQLALRDQIEGLGYPRAEWQAALGTDLTLITLRDVLQFVRRRRQKPRYDQATDTIICDGPVQPCRALELADAAV